MYRRRSQWTLFHPQYTVGISVVLHAHMYASVCCRPIMARSLHSIAWNVCTPIFLRLFQHEVWLCENHYWDFHTLFIGFCHWLCCLLCSLLEQRSRFFFSCISHSAGFIVSICYLLTVCLKVCQYVCACLRLTRLNVHACSRYSYRLTTNDAISTCVRTLNFGLRSVYCIYCHCFVVHKCEHFMCRKAFHWIINTWTMLGVSESKRMPLLWLSMKWNERFYKFYSR